MNSRKLNFNPSMIAMGVALAGASAVFLAACAKGKKMPAADGAVVEIRRSDGMLRKGDRGFGNTLQLSWFGSGCHLIQFGETRVLTDPFVTNELKLSGMWSDPVRVRVTFERIPVPDMVLVNHSHHDHILDAHAAMSLPSWRAAGVPLYGGQTCRNILAGWGDADVDNRVRAIPGNGGVLSGTEKSRVRVTAFRSEHGPHLKCGYTLANGTVDQPRKSPPSLLRDYQSGESFNYLLEFPRSGRESFNVFYLGTPYHLDKRPESLPPAGTRIDVAIILAPSADNVRGYPEEHLAILQPRHIVFSHFNTFAKEDPDEQLSLAGIDFVKMPVLSRDVQSTFALKEQDYPGFEKLHIPAITVMGPGGTARNVLRIR